MHTKRLLVSSDYTSGVRLLIFLQTNEVGVIDDDALFGDEVEGEDNPFVMGGFVDMFGEDFLGLRELGIASELGVSSLSVPKKLLRPKGARVGAGSSLPYVETVLAPFLLACSFMVPLFRHAEVNQQNRRLLFHRHPPSLRSNQRGWKTKSSVSCGPTTRLASILLHSLKSSPPNTCPLPQMVSQRPGALRPPTLHRLSQASFCSRLSPIQHHSNPKLQFHSNLHSRNHQQYPPFRTMCQLWPKPRWDHSDRSLVGNLRTLLRRRKRGKRRILHYLHLVAAAEVFLVP